jgi:RHS repeat-associated protein
VISRLPRGTGTGNFSWLTWTSAPDAVSLAQSLIPPGNSALYTSLDDPADHRVDIGDWLEGAPGSMNSAAVRERLGDLVGEDIVLPAYEGTRGQGNRFDYRVGRFVVVRLQEFNLTGQGWLTFEYRGDRRCYNRPAVSQDQQLRTPEDTALPILLTATDSQNDPLTFAVLTQPAHGSLSGTGPSLVYTPAPDYNGPDSFTFVSNDGMFDSTPATVSIEVLPVNDPPRFTSTPPTEAADGVAYVYQATAVDIDIGDVLVYALTDAPEGMRIDPITGLVEWTPTLAQVGTHTTTATVTDRAGASDTQTWTVVVVRSNRPPEIVSSPTLEALDGRLYTYPVVAEDSDPGDVLAYALTQAPAGMRIDAATGEIVWTPTVEQVGNHDVTVVVTDRAGASDTQSWTIVVARSNRPPEIVSSPTLEALDGRLYTYPVVAEDSDPGDVLAYALTQAPAGMRINAATGEIVWTPTVEQVGNHDVTVVVTDRAGASDTQSWTIVVARSNRPPMIVSTPVQDAVEDDGYRYPVQATDPDLGDILTYSLPWRPQGMSIAPDSGLISWNVAGWAGNNLLPNTMCYAGGEQFANLAPAADVVVVVDESGSMSGEHDWLADFAAPLEAHLSTNGVGAGAVPNRYGLIGYEAAPRPISMPPGLMGNYREFIAATAALRISGGTEDGWRSIRHAITSYPLRSDAARNIILVTDEDRDNADASISYNSLLAELRSAKAVLNAVVNARFRCGDGTAALGLGQNKVGYKADGRGGYVTCANASATSGGGTTIADYVNLALATGGAAWDIDVLRNGGLVAQSFTNALLKIKVQEILQQLPTRNQSDAYVQRLRAYSGWIHVDIGNRGLSAFGSAMEVQIFADDMLIASAPVPDLAPGGLHPVVLPWVIPIEPERLSARLVAPSDIGECKVDNNRLDVAWVRARATDRGGLFDEQSFSVQPVDSNDAPTIVSTPPTAIGVGRRLGHQVVANDDDRGDAIAYSLAAAPLGMSINRLTGELTWLPDAAQQGAHTVEVVATDLAGATARQRFTLTVDAALLPPRFTSAPERRAIQGTLYVYAPQVSADPASQLQFDAFMAPSGFAMDPQTGAIEWQVPANFAGKSERILLRVRDQFGNYDLQVYILLGDLPNQAPRIVSSPGMTATVGSAYAYSPTVSDVNVLENFRWRLDVGPATIAYNTTTGALSWPAASVGSSQPASMAAFNPYCLAQDVAVTPFSPRLAWSSNRVAFAAQPLVGPLADTDGDGELSSADLMGLVTVSWTDSGSSNRRIHAFNARTGQQLWSFNQRIPDWNVQPAMADLEGTGEATILFVDNLRHLVALRPDGVLRWVSTAPIAPSTLNHSAVIVTDIEGDGSAEILVGPSVYTAAGALKWQFSARTSDNQGNPIAIDLNGDGRREVVYRGEIRDANGVLRSRLQSARDTSVRYSFHAPVDMPGIDGTHLAVSESTNAGIRLSVVDGNGNALWVLNGVPAVGPPLVADFTGDGIDDIYLAAANRLYTAQGTVAWTTAVGNGSNTNFRAAIATDIDRDGELDILGISPSTSSFNILAGRTGAVIGRIANMSGDMGATVPTLVDLDGNGQATLFVGDASMLRAYRAASGQPWHSAARVFHQQPFALDQIRTDLRLNPADPSRPPAATQVVGQRQAVDTPTVFLPDLRVSAPFGIDGTSGLRLSADVVNRGTGPSGTGEVAFYRGDFAGGTLLGKVALGALSPGQTLRVEFPTSRAAVGDGEVTAVVLASPADTECETGNNVATGRVMQISVADYGALEATQSWVVAVDERMVAPSFATTAPNRVVENDLYRYVARAVSPHVGDTVVYELIGAPEGASVHPRTGEVSWKPRWRQTGRFGFTLQARSLNGLTVNQSWNVDVVASTVANGAPTIVSTPVTAATLNQLYRYDVRATDPEGQFIAYSLANAPTGMRIDAATGTILWVPQSVPTASVDVRVLAVDERLGQAEQSFSIRMYQTPNRAPNISGAPALSIELGQTWQYTVAASDPDGDPLTYVWTQLPAGVTVSGDTASWTPTAVQLGEQAFVVEVRDDRGGLARQSFTVFVIDPATNSAPRITSTPNPRAVAGSAYAYPVVAVDDENDPLAYSLVERPQGMTIDVATGAIAWTPALDQLGNHAVRVQVVDGRGGVVWQSWIVQVVEPGSGGGNGAPRILSAAASSAKVGFEYRYAVLVSDPDGDLLAYSLTESPVGMSIDAMTGRIVWSPEQPGTYPVRVRVSDGTLWTEQGWTLTVADGAPLSASIELPTGLVAPGESLFVRIVPVNAASQVNVALTLDGVLVPVESDLTAVVSSTVVGPHLLEVVVSDGYETTSASVEFFVLNPGSGDAPTLTLTVPADGATVSAPVDVTGSATDIDLAGWTLTAIDKSGTSSRLIASGSANVSGVLAAFDPTQLLNGQYVLVLRAWDRLGHEATAYSNVLVDGEMKLGHFSLTYEDVSIPVMGIPITVTRTYDSRRSGRSLDFGFGWTVDYQNVRVQESRTLGVGWSLRQEGGGFFPNWCVRPSGDPIVSVTLPDGKVEKFRAKASPECQFLVPAIDVQLVFEALPGTYSKLAQTSYGSLRVSGTQLIDLGDSGPADPNSYRLTSREGTAYDIDQNFGIRRVSDLNGNTLSYTRDGVRHSSGVGVDFIRDQAGRIVRMQLPDGSGISYGYDGNGDLTAVTDQVGETSRFGYLQGRYAHYLQDLFDARGVRAARNEYDANGRLVAHIDANGQRITYDIDVEGRTQTIRDRLGNATTYVFDANGRVLQEINALGETVKRTYDALGNELSLENAEGEIWRWEYDTSGNKVKETNPHGQVMTWRYDSRGQVLTQTDPSGAVRVNNTYSALTGLLMSATNALGERTDLAYSANGGLLEMRQPLGVTLRYAYDARGNLMREVDASGAETTFTYDAAGRVHTITRYRTDRSGVRRTLTTTNAYDAKGRPVSVTDPLGNVIRTEYDENDRETAKIDALGRRTEMAYDVFGNLIATRHPDGTSELQTYDAEGRVVSRTDRAGRTTTMVHDAAGRLVETRHPDGAVVRSLYDKAGREIAKIDARGNATSFVYDDAGRLVQTINPLGNVTTTTYNPNGTKASVRDGLGRVTKLVYDAENRPIETIHPDATVSDADNPRSRTTYDALGRKTSETDEAGRNTAYEYTPTGLLSAVVDPAGMRTEFDYDERSSKVSQRDALGRATYWGYDDAGRMVERILPLGQRETRAYDAAGNLAASVDFNGAQTTRRYDVNGRVVEVIHADGSFVRTTYTASGKIAEQTNPSGTTRHTYDAMDRVVRVVRPDGEWIDYAYDAAGNRTRMTTSRQEAAYSYDPMNRLATVEQNAQTTRYTYDAVGNRASVALPNGVRTDYAYDLRNRLRTLFHRTATGVVLFGATYTTDASGLRTQLVEQSVGATRTVVYQYDALKRLTREQVTDTTRGNRTSVWTYDAVGNRLTESRTKAAVTVNTVYAYDDNDRLLSHSNSAGASVSYQYDANGNLVGKTEAAGTSTFVYDGAGRLTDAITPSAALSYGYGADGVRVSQTVNGIGTRFVVDAAVPYAQVVEEVSAPGNVLHLVGDDRIARIEAGQVRYLHADGLGSTRALSNGSASVAERWWYEAFGAVEERIGTAGNTFLFAGEQLDPNLGFYYLRARWMDPNTGRFLTQDPFPGLEFDPVTLHKYLYANASPTNYIDPSGEISLASYSAGINVALNTVRYSFGVSRIAGGRALNALGTAVENAVGGILRMIPGATVTGGPGVSPIALVGPGGTRFLDFMIVARNQVAYLEVKYSMPAKGSAAFSRLIGQMRTFVSAAEARKGGAQVVLFTYRAPTAAQTAALAETLGPTASSVQHVYGLLGLTQWIRIFFGVAL